MGFRFFRKRGEYTGGKELPHLARGLNSTVLNKKEPNETKIAPASAIKSQNRLPVLPDISNINLKKNTETKTGAAPEDVSSFSLKTTPELPQQPSYKNTSFSNLVQHLSKEESIISKRIDSGKEEILSRDLLQEMKNYWKKNKDMIKIDFEGKKIEREALNKIKELQRLEIEWQKRQIIVEENQQNLVEIELKMDSRIRELRAIFDKIEYEQEVPEEYYFYLKDGRVLKTIKELIAALSDMEDSVFYHHVTDEKNDFANWIGEIIKDYYLAEQLQKARTKEQVLKVFSG